LRRDRKSQNNVKRVAIIGADFSPSSLPPATRIRFFASHLPEFGWEPIIITTSPKHYETSVDPENEQLLPQHLWVVRTPALPAAWTRKVGIGDLGIRSLWFQWQALKQICREQKIDLILIPVPPYVSMILGRLAHRKFGVPYLIDYIDPWVTESYWNLPKSRRPPKWPLADALSRTVEPFALRRAAGIVGVSKGTTDSVVQRHPWLKAGIEIPYGAELGDFDYVRQHPRNNEIFKADNYVHLSSVGAYTETMREPLLALFEGFRSGLEKTPEVFARVRLHFVGTSYSSNGRNPYRVAAVARDAGVERYVHEHPMRISYLDSLQLMLDSDGLILLGSNEPHYTASKAFPYILAKKPLLGIFHEDSSVVSIVRDVGDTEVLTFGPGREPMLCADKIRKRLEQMLTADQHESAADWKTFEKYSAKAMTQRLVGVMNAAVGQRGDSSQ